MGRLPFGSLFFYHFSDKSYKLYLHFMYDINNQTGYWNRVASSKTFTHPVDINLIKTHIDTTANVLDYGCGYGRLTQELYNAGFKNLIGVDSSIELARRGKITFQNLNLIAIEDARSIPVEASSIDMLMLFAVLTCIPSNAGQKELMEVLYGKLKKGGIIYISDYYLQQSRLEVGEYQYYENDANNYGVFTLDEGVTFRHHTREWIKELLGRFETVSEKMIEVKTMNGHVAEAFQMIVRK